MNENTISLLTEAYALAKKNHDHDLACRIIKYLRSIKEY